MNTISKYEIIEIINKNGPNAVYLARHKKLNRKTLLKVYSGADNRLINRFEREAKIVADLNSDSVVSIYDYGEEEKQFYISMEYIDGSNLAEYLEKNKLSIEQVIDFAVQIASALSTLHKKGYIHRDLKPENILVDKNLKIKLTDFGLSIHQSLKRVTSEGTLLGTPMYMSPEQINNLPVDYSSDIFAFGIILYQMTCNKHPFDAPQVGEIFSKILSAEPTPPSIISESIPAWFSEMILRMLSKDSQNRFQNASEILKHIRTNIPGELSNSDVDKATVQQAQNRIPNLVFPVMLILVVSVSYYLFYYNRQHTANPVSSDSVLEVMTDTLQQVIHTPDTTKQQILITNQWNKNTYSGSNEHSLIRNPRNNKPHRIYNTEDSDSTMLLVRTSPWCSIYLNYELYDKTPMIQAINLDPGKYLLGLQNPLYPSLSDSIEIKYNKLNIYEYNLDSTFFRLNLEVNPWGNVIIDGKLIGTTPILEPIYLARQDHIVEIQNDYYPVWRDTLRWNGETVIEKKIILTNKFSKQD